MELWKRYGRGLPSRCNGYGINTGAGNVLRVLALLGDRELSEKVKVRYSLRLLLRPLSALRARLLPLPKKRELLHRILDGLGAEGGSHGSSQAVISMYQDSGLIYAALLQSYRLDLMKEEQEEYGVSEVQWDGNTLLTLTSDTMFVGASRVKLLYDAEKGDLTCALTGNVTESFEIYAKTGEGN